MLDFGAKLADAMEQRGLSQTELAFLMRQDGFAMDPGAVSRIVRGRNRNPELEKVAAFAQGRLNANRLATASSVGVEALEQLLQLLPAAQTFIELAYGAGSGLGLTPK